MLGRISLLGTGRVWSEIMITQLLFPRASSESRGLPIGCSTAAPTISRPAIRLTGDPRSGYLTLVTSANLTLARAEIVSVSGQVIASYNAPDAGSTDNHFTLPVRNLAHGFYLVRIYDQQGDCTTCKTVLP